MSLIKQLWIAVVVLMTLAFVSSFAISTMSAREYFEEQLSLKNIDNAASLALTLSQIDKDPVMIELLISAQFDTGHYQRIELVAPGGDVYESRLYNNGDDRVAPDWFMQLVPIQVAPGVAHVQDGWHQFGTLQVESQVNYAYAALWQATRELFVWFLLVAVGFGALGTVILKLITRPLDDVVSQAEAIGGRRFITSEEPRTLEFNRVVRAMNLLSDRIRVMLESETKRLEEMRYKNQHDALTGVANREYFLGQLDACLAEDDLDSHHAILLLRVEKLAELNQQLGRVETDQLLKRLVEVMHAATRCWSDKYSEVEYGRLNGSDFAILLTHASDLKLISDELLQGLQAVSDAVPESVSVKLPHAGCYFRAGDKRAQLMMHLDSLLAIAENRDETCAELSTQPTIEARFQNADEWRNTLAHSLHEEGVQGQFYPVRTLQGELLHEEVMMRMRLGGQLRSAGYFIPWARRLGMLPQLDLAMLKVLLDTLTQGNGDRQLALNLSIETLADTSARNALLEQLRRHPQQARSIWLELPEHSVVQHLDLFREFCTQVQPLGCRLGLERSGSAFARLERLQELGLDYLKVNAALSRDLSINQANQTFLRGLCTLAHSIGLQVIAEGVMLAEEADLLAELGFDAISGPGVTR